MKRLLVIEDDFSIRQAVRNAFTDSSRIETEFETDSLEKALQYYRTRLAPHLILLDINLNGISGLEGLPQLRRHFPDAAIVVFTILEDEDKVFQAICHGASGYLLKSTPYEELEKHLLVTLEDGGSPVSPPIARRILNYFKNGARFIPKKSEHDLTEIEQTLVSLLVDALTYQEIADKLGISINGVRYYIKRIYAKLQIKSRGQLVRRYLENPTFFK